MEGHQRSCNPMNTLSATLPPFPAFLVLTETDTAPSLAAERTHRGHEALVESDSCQSSKASKMAAFFDLPAEIRLEIFERCVSPIRSSSPFDHHFKKITADRYRFTDYFMLPVLFADSFFPLNLLILSKRVTAEAQETIYRKISFELIATHSRYMFAYSYYLEEHPMRLTERLTLRLLHDVWTSRRYGGVPRLGRDHWGKLSHLIAGMPNLRRLTIRILHNAQNEDVDSSEKYVDEGMAELGDGLRITQEALKESSANFVVEFAAPESDYANPEQRERLAAVLRDKELPVTVGATCSWITACTQDSGAYMWSPVGWASDVSGRDTDMLDAKDLVEVVPATVQAGGQQGLVGGCSNSHPTA